jgi:CTP synthase
MKYIVITGGVISGLGKGITSSSIGLLLKSYGISVTSIKIDPYLNLDAGTMSPYEHGECYVLADGGEADLDMGNYERFLGIELTRNHNITTGKIYQSVLTKERNGDYLGKTVQIVPHITDEIKDWISDVANQSSAEVCLIEVGGTVGDIEVMPFIEALRQMKMNDDDTFCFIHVSLVINLGEPKTKPTQTGLQKLRSLGIVPDILVVRTADYLSDSVLSKLETFSGIKKAKIIQNVDVDNIYYVPDLFLNQGLIPIIQKITSLNLNETPRLDYYYSLLDYYDHDDSSNKLHLGIVGKYIGSPDTYLSIIRAIESAAFHCNVHVKLCWVTGLTGLFPYDGLLIPGGFGSRGIEEKLLAAEYARKYGKPILGICLGMQVMVVDCYNSLDKGKAYSTEWVGTEDNDDLQGTVPIIDILPNQTNKLGGTMRLGNYKTTLTESKVQELYGTDTIVERHRHRYEVNNLYVDELQTSGLKVVGKTNELVEVVELENHPFYVGCQFHPEFKSRYDKPHPLFVGWIKAMMK